jgi:hypothetical protein
MATREMISDIIRVERASKRERERERGSIDGDELETNLRSVDELVGKALSNGLDVTESSLTSTGGKQVDSLVHSAEWRNIDGLTTRSTSRTDTGRVFTRTRVDDGVNQDLYGVLVGQEVDDLEGVLDDAHSHALLTVVATVHHQRVGETLDNGALGLAETLDVVALGGVGEESVVSLLLLDSNVVLQSDIADGDVIVRPKNTSHTRANLISTTLTQSQGQSRII